MDATMETQFTIAACIVANEGTLRKCLAWRDPAFTPILDFGLVSDAVLLNHYLRRISEPGAPCKNLGIRMLLNDPGLLDRLAVESPSSKPQTLVLGLPNRPSRAAMTAARKIAEQVFLEVYSADTAPRFDGLDPDGWVIRGNEAGGICADTSNPTLLRSIREKSSQPIWMFGGAGFQSALAYAIGGADGIVLSDALLLLPEVADDLKENDLRAVKAAIRTQAVDIGHGLQVRISEAYPDLIERVRNLCLRHDRRPREAEAHVDTRLAETLAIMAQYPPTARCFLGEEVGWAAEWGQTFGSIADLAQALRRALAGQLEVLRTAYPFGQGSALARELQAEYPILQGPMTHVSDRPAFLAGVAQNGAIPFLALGLSRADQLDPLLRETQTAVNGRPWGVGLIGFAPKALQDEQLARIEKYKPDLAIVAGGRPAHYKTLRDLGIVPFLHIPVPSMIANFFKEGVRHFIFEGRGCGGHVGPINSYPLWQSALIEFQKLAAAGEDLSAVRIALAGGIYDARSAAMAGAFCPPLLAHGVQFGVIVGTAYLFTREIVASAAITPVFQEVALDSEHTVVIEGGIGHAIRCAPTPITEQFASVKAALLGDGLAPQELQAQLDQLNVGRLRLAAKGVMRAGRAPSDEALVAYSEANQVKEGLFMLGEVATLMDRTIGMADLHRSLCGDAERLIAQTGALAFHSREAARPTIASKPTDMAIIGMSALLPGAENLDAFWRNVLAKIYCIREVPEDRWRAAVNYHPDPNHKDTAYSTKGGFLGELPINCMEYGIPPGSMQNVEPAQLLALEAVKQALIDAGYAQREFDREKTSVIFGFAGGGDLLLAYSARATLREYMARAQDIPEKIRADVLASVNAVLPEWSEDAFPGILGNVIAGRVANRFDLNGLNFTMDAACASSMAALQVACQELAYGSTKVAIVGGVDASQHPFGYTCFSKTKALSLSGQSKPFSPEADGIVLGEGVGVVVLKRLADAIADGDRIYAVVKGIGGASDGKGSGMTVPVSRGQKLAIHRAYELTGFKTDSVELIEAHGTGTPLGDRVELETIHEVLQQHGATQPCALGSIKAAIGHTKGAAGIIGVIKTALALHHKVLPAQANVDTAHPAVSNPRTGLYLNTQSRPWFRRRPEQPRRAGASAFGFGGTNFHAVLEEFESHAPAGADFPPTLWPAELFFFGAQDAKTLVKRIEATLGLLSREDRPLARLALEHHTQQAPFTATPVRLAVRAEDLPQLKARLEQSKSLIAAGRLDAGGGAAHPPLPMGEGLWAARHDAPAAPLTALFPGQGAQKLDMLRDLALVFPIVRECLDHANAILARDFFPAAQGVLTDYIYPPTVPSAEAQKEALQALTQTAVAQPALAAVEMALYRLLLQFNVCIDLAAGHSFGELTALWAAGALNDRQLLTLAAKRGRCMAQSSEVATGMVAVQIQRAALEKYIEGVAELSIANHNTPQQVVVSGSISALETFEAHCRQQKWGYKRLPVSQGFHSPYMASAEAHWRNALAEERFSTLTMPVFANLTAAPYGPTAPEIADTLGRHLRHGVNFVGEIEALHAAGSRTFLEIGPGATLTRFVDAILADKPHQAIAVQPREGQAGVAMLLDTLAALFVLGHDIDLQPAYAHRVIRPARPKPAASATLFMVNGGRAKATVELRARKETAPKPPRWEQPPAPVSARPVPAPNPSPPAAGVPGTQPHPGGVSVLADQEKLSTLKHFQKSMSLFLETQERFHQQRLTMMEKMWNINQQLLQGLLGGSPGPPQAPADQRPAPRPPAPERVVAEVPQPPRPMEQTPKAAPPDAPVDYQALLFDIISERTQYPVDMLAPEQQIEADLGIDSIKRVEIIGMLQDTHPSLGDIGNEKYFEDMAQLKTLGDIVRWIEAHFGATQTAPAGAGTAPQPSPAAPKAGERVDYQALLFAVISERTQYPVDMLAPEQQIEADLGIDSIKRVEIIGMLQGTHPSLGDIGNEKYFEDMAQLKTLGDIVAWITQHFGAPSSTQAPVATPPTPEVPAEPEAVSRATPGQYKPLVLAAIGERTLYPVELIEMGMDLEEDLGIDPDLLKELLRALADSHPSHEHRNPIDPSEALGKLTTVQDLIDWVEQKFAQNPPAGDALPVATVTNPAPADQSLPHPVFHRYLLKLVPRPLDLSRTRNFDGVLLILDGGHGLGRQIHIKAQEMGVQCVRVVDEGVSAPEHASCIRMNFSEEQDYSRCYRHIKQSVGAPAGILNLLALGQKTHAAAYDAVLHSFLWAKTIGADPDLLPLGGRQLFWTSVSSMGGDFGLNPAMDFEACQNGVHGITKSLFHEWPGLQTKTIDIHAEGNLEQIAQGVLDECHEVMATIKEVGLTGDGRNEMVLVDRPLDSVAPQAHFDSAPVFLLTGGAKGITADVAAFLAQRYAPTLIVTGRTPLPERSPEDSAAFMARAARAAQDPKRFKSEIIDTLKATGEQVSPALVNEHFNAIVQEYKARRNIARMEQLGAKVFYYACDCTDEPSFAGLLRHVYQRHHKIDGVIHAAGYLKDGLITQKSMAHFKRVLDTKVEGARILMRELDFQKLDFIVFFSSVSGRFGNQGQADYAAANEILNKMAVKIDMRWPGKATAINWGPWEGEGMVSSQVKKQFDEAGVFLLPRDLGAHMLNLEILQSARSPEVIIFGARDIDRRLPVLQVPEASAPLPFVERFEPLGAARSAPHETAWQLTLDQTAPYLSDHRINGTPVLPAAVAMEIMAQAAMAAQPGYRFQALHDFKLIKGITLGPQGPVKLTVTARKTTNATRKSALIEVRLAMPDQADRCNYAATILLTREQNGNGHIPNLTPSTHSRRFDQPVEAVYAERLFHTGVFRALRTIDTFEIADLQNNGIRGSLHTSSPQRILGAPTQGAWLLDPIVFDGAYQLSLLWIQECYDLMALPGDIKKYVQYRPYNGGPIHCDIAVKTAHFPRVILDFNFSDEAGRLYAKATDVAAIMKKDLKRTRRGPLEKETAASA
jgi:acyl transferase domain-containing protein/NAD(P)H-dependent flavin oxidoreductase YrpB (nitropropane dioxygenase family)/NAD(P)-dependent dehydrogenase (short-subunit alcohol dehydrogenase family)